MKKTEEKTLWFIIGAIMAAVLIAVFVSPFASSFPDGLEKVAQSQGFAGRASAALDEGFFIMPEYNLANISGSRWGGPVSGLFGVLVVLAFFGLIYLAYRAYKKKKG